jgi:Icc-related predicted phosphoesterase
MFDQHVVLKTEAEVADIEWKIRNRGYYPVRMSDDDYDQLQADPEEITRRFTQVILQEAQRRIETADDKLRGKAHRVIVCPASDDMFELDPLLHQQGHVVETNDRDPLDLDGFQMISLGWTNPTPWNTLRELSENELAKRVDELVAKVTDPSRTIFNFHAPPYRSRLDEAPGPDENLNMKAGGRAMQPVGSTSVRTAIERVQPLLRLHGHISTKAGERYGSAGRWHSTHGAATKRAGRARHTRPEKARIKNYVLVNGQDRPQQPPQLELPEKARQHETPY